MDAKEGEFDELLFTMDVLSDLKKIDELLNFDELKDVSTSRE
ncbi:hypothetical protein Poly51_25910 [Rubripirellula tenax]|uniref:Uncharacterized protein n=1 Tax=Rubripirellula tenax TaxID=2528015 RepID=A0A5C6F861_9BACT|nr:hypothetical protein [Rubripirellula tenax]TWU56674.1 hypothetical protein Poly51_25910 [Rubripirellula tenax]